MSQTTLSESYERQLANDSQSAQRISEIIVHRMAQKGWAERDIFAVQLALSEGITNGIEHGNGNDPRLFVMVEAKVGKRRVWLRIVDEGPGFDQSQVPDPTQPPFKTEPHGRGVLLMRKLMDRVTFHDQGNDVRMEKRRSQE